MLELTDGRRLHAAAFVDATELGDLLPLAGCPWITGSEGRDSHGEDLAAPGGSRPSATQAITWCVILRHDPQVARSSPAPSGYANYRQRFAFDIAGWDGEVHRYRMFSPGPQGRQPFWDYRRLSRDAALINWVGNDYADASLLDEPVRARRESRRLTEAFVHWLRTDAPHDDGLGHGFAVQPDPVTAGTEDGYALFPYVREARRIRTAHPVTGAALQPAAGQARAVPVDDSVGIAWYPIDLHPRVGLGPATTYAETAPFQIPVSALRAPTPSNLLAGATNLAATQVAAAAYRTHAGEWAIGEAAGTAAAVDTRHGGQAPLVDIQYALARRGVPLAWLTDLPTDHPAFVAGQLLAAHGGLAGARLTDLAVHPDEPASPDDVVALRRAAAELGWAPTTPETSSWTAAAAGLSRSAARAARSFRIIG